MRVCLLFEPRLWEGSPARHAAETLASLLEWRWRPAVSGSDVRADEAVVFVGSDAEAPADTAALLRVDEWPFWSPASLEAGAFDGVPLPCPGGAVDPVSGPVEFPPQWLRAAGFLLGREEELLDGRRDQWDCYSGAYTQLGALGLLDVPLVNAWAAQLAGRIEAWCEHRHVTFERIPRWKDGAPFAVALTHDVDDVTLRSGAMAWRLLRQARGPRSYAFRAGARGVLRALLPGPREDPYWTFDRWAAEERARGFSSTFFFFAGRLGTRHAYDALYRHDDQVGFDGQRASVAAVMRALARAGFEIGLHGSYLSHRDAKELAEQRRQIEEAKGVPVIGIRQHFLRFDVHATWEAQEEAGFLYDATLGYNEALGFRAGIAAPFHPFDHRRGGPRRLLALPLTAMDGTLFRTLDLDAAGAAARVREHLERVERAGGLAALLWHPNAAAERHFRGWWPVFLETLDHLAARGAWVTNGAEITAWWRERATRQTAET